MSELNKPNENNNPSFIKEQIVPNKKNKRKKLVQSIEVAALCAVVFGLVGSLTFVLSRPYFESTLGKKVNPVTFTEAPTPPTPTPTPSSAPMQAPVEVEFPEMSTEQIQGFYDVLSETAEKFNRSVVTVCGIVNGVDWFDNPSELSDTTSGIIIAKTEYNLFLLTAYNRISDATSIRIVFPNGTAVEAQLTGKDKETNLAILTVALSDIPSAIRKTLEPVVLGDSYYAQSGTPVLALGSPNGATYSMDFGIVSDDFITRYITDNKLELFHTSMLASANGEGAIIDLEGKILGIITHSEDADTQFCTAIGITRLKPLIEKLVNNESYASLGVIANDIPSEYKDSISIKNGIYISSVNNKSAALKAGLKAGDIILKIDDYEVTSVSMFNNLLTQHQPKDSVTLSIYRTSTVDDKEMKITVELGKK